LTNIEDLEELKEKLEDQKADMEEVNDFFKSAAKSDEDEELLDELNELEAQMEEEELAKLEVGFNPLPSAP
jgi:hypothetical protein